MLTEDQMRHRRFIFGSLSTLKTFLNSQFSQLRSDLDTATNSLPKYFDQIFRAKIVEPITLKETQRIERAFADISRKIEELNNSINLIVKKDPVRVETKEVDFRQIVEKLASLERTILKIEIPEVNEKVVGTNKIVAALETVKKQIAAIPQPEKVEIPQPEVVTFPESISLKEAGKIIFGLSDLQKDIRALPKNIALGTNGGIDMEPLLKQLIAVEKAISSLPKPEKFEFPDTINVGNFPPQKIPQPVTHISINSLNGFVKTTAATVTTTLTTIPTYGTLNNRRSLILYNNSSNTIFYGGSDVTTSNGMPVAAGTHSPIIDAGSQMIVYALAASGNNNVRVMEISDEASGR